MLLTSKVIGGARAHLTGPHSWDHESLDLRCNLACPWPARIKLLFAVSAVGGAGQRFRQAKLDGMASGGMWATRLRCPSEAAYPRRSPPPRFCPCRRATRPSASDCSSPDAGVENCKGHPRTDAGPRLAAAGVSFQMYFFIFDRAPQPFDENVIHEPAAPVHRNRDA